MGTRERRARDRENIREEILDAARSLFVREGYDRVSIRQIADRIEYSPGTIYLHFKDKADIFQTICNETFGILHRRLSAIADDNSDPLEKLRRAGRAYVHFSQEHAAHYTLIFMSPAMSRLPEAPEQAEDMGRLCFGDLCRIVQQCVERDLLRSTDVGELSHAIWACVHGVSALLIVDKAIQIEASRLIERVIDIGVEGVRKQI